jgi:hypothetical protein
MGIAKFDDGIIDNPKFEKAGAAACWLWFCSVLVSRRGLTDGFISKLKVQTLVPGLTQPYKHADKLVQCGLWDEALGGYQVHDYLEWNPSKIQVEEYRQHDKDRKQSARRQKSSSGVDTTRNPNGFQTDSERRGATHAGAKSLSVSLSAVSGFDLPGESAREGDDDEGPTGGLQPVWTTRGRARAGLVVTHLKCLPLASAACERGWCVPAFLVTREWLPQVEHHELEITKFIANVLLEQPDGPIGDDPLTFWRARWRERHGTTVKPSHRPTAVESNLRGLREDLGIAEAVAILDPTRRVEGTRES